MLSSARLELATRFDALGKVFRSGRMIRAYPLDGTKCLHFLHKQAYETNALTNWATKTLYER